MAQAKRGEAKRTVSFFRVVTQNEAGVIERIKDQDWQKILEHVRHLSLEDRTVLGSSRQLIGNVMSVDGELALKLMEPRNENSWLEILKQSRETEGLDSEAIDPETIGKLVETTIVAFLGSGNIVGMIRGSTASPTFAALAEWLGGLKIGGRGLSLRTGVAIVLEPALSQAQEEKLRKSDGVSKASVRMSTTKAEILNQIGSVNIARTFKSLRETYGDIVVTITLKVPSGKANDAARLELKREAERLRAVSESAEAVSATLVTYDPESRSHSEEINFVAQRITAQATVPLTGDDGQPIRNDSAVRAILKAGFDLRKELDQ